MITDRKILITGDQGLGGALAQRLTGNHVTVASRSLGFDIGRIEAWAAEFENHDIIINNAYDAWAQIAVLEYFYSRWQNLNDRMIVSIGSMVADHTRSQREVDHEYWPYRLHKQSLQLACQQMCQTAACDIKIINPGPIDTQMCRDIRVPKMCPHWLAEKIIWVMQQPEIKRLDLWR